MRTNAILMLGVAMLTLSSCGGDPDPAPKPTTATSAGDRGMVDETRRPGPALIPKSHIGYVRKDAPAGPPPAAAREAMASLEALRAEIGDERFGKASRVLSCRDGRSVPKDPMAEFNRRAARIRAIASEGSDLDAELAKCATELRARR